MTLNKKGSITDVGEYSMLTDVTQIQSDPDFLRNILEISLQGLQVVDKRGIIVFVNESYEEIHKVKRENIIGKHVTEVIENTRMHIVAQTGIREKDQLQEIHGKEFVVSRIPIHEKGECVGAAGFIRFQYTDEVKNLTKKVEKLEKELKHASNKIQLNADTNFSFEDIVAIAQSSMNAKDIAKRAAASDSTVLLLGESGVGKEVYAHSIHNMSTRNKGPFIRMNCSAIQESLFESELFGYQEGAFTGAKKGGKKGKFELANNGTIFLDEIGEMPLQIQAKLLRVIQEREIDKLGDEKTIDVDVRIIAATNQNLDQLVDEGKFRKDLYYRLNVIPIVIPPLRERMLDIPKLVQIFWEKLQKKRGIYYKTLDYSALVALEEHSWPGNIRELNNVLERAMAVVVQDVVNESHINTIIKGRHSDKKDFCVKENCKLSELIENTERGAISIALVKANNNRSKAAKILGISRALLYKKMNIYKLN